MAGLSFFKCHLGPISFYTESKLPFLKILSELKINVTVKNSQIVTRKLHIRNGWCLFLNEICILTTA